MNSAIVLVVGLRAVHVVNVGAVCCCCCWWLFASYIKVVVFCWQCCTRRTGMHLMVSAHYQQSHVCSRPLQGYVCVVLIHAVAGLFTDSKSSCQTLQFTASTWLFQWSVSMLSLYMLHTLLQRFLLYYPCALFCVACSCFAGLCMGARGKKQTAQLADSS